MCYRPTMTPRMENFLRDEGGTTAIEYCLMAAMFALVIMIAVTTLGQETSNMYDTISSSIVSAS
jgi:pilus assembly protein Flp/PilA